MNTDAAVVSEARDFHLTRFEILPLSLREVEGDAVASCFLGAATPEGRVSGLLEGISTPVPETSFRALGRLLARGPFPEPLCLAREDFCEKWHEAYPGRVIQREIGSASRLRDFDLMEEAFFSVAGGVGRTFSEAAVARALGVSHVSVKSWLEWLERAYLIFSVPPWFRNVPRALKKGKKWFFYDCFYVKDPHDRVLSTVALALHRTCRVLNDLCLGNYALHYVKTIDQRGIDFLVTREGVPVLCVDVARDHQKPSRVFRNRASWFGSPAPPGILIVPEQEGTRELDPQTWSLGLVTALRILL